MPRAGPRILQRPKTVSTRPTPVSSGPRFGERIPGKGFGSLPSHEGSLTMRLSVPLALAALLIAGCDREETNKITPASRDLGTGLNTVERTYARPPADLVPVIQSSLQALDLKIDSEKHDNLGGEIVAIRATGQKVIVTTKGLESNRCTVL